MSERDAYAPGADSPSHSGKQTLRAAQKGGLRTAKLIR